MAVQTAGQARSGLIRRNAFGRQVSSFEADVSVKGAGANPQAERRRQLMHLFGRATRSEQDFLRRLRAAFGVSP